MNAPEFLMDKVEADSGIDNNDMKDLAGLMKAYDDAQTEMENAEAILKMKKDTFNELALQKIPEFLLSHGISKMSLADGRKVEVKEDISVTIKDKALFREWLKSRNESDIVKVKYSFGRMPDKMLEDLSDFLMNKDYEFEVDESIHAATQKKYFKELLKDMNREDLPEWVTIFDIRQAKIK